MGLVKLELRCPQKVEKIEVEPQPDWSFDSLLSELDSLEKKLTSSSNFPVPFTKNQSRGISDGKTTERLPVAFSMRISEEELELSEDEEEEDTRAVVALRRFSCDNLCGSETDDSDQEFSLAVQPYLMDEVGLVEGALYEQNNDHHLELQEEIRSIILDLRIDIKSENRNCASADSQIKKYAEARTEADHKLDTLYNRKMAEGLDDHLTAVQRDHELKSQLEERRIRSDAAAYEEAKRKERAIQEERMRQERAAKEEAEAKRRNEEARIAALEAEKKAKDEAAKREAAKQVTAVVSPEQTIAPADNTNPDLAKSNATKTTQGGTVRASEAALTLEQGRLQKLRDLTESNQSLMSRSNMNFSTQERHIARLIKQIRGTEENVRTKASELIKLCSNPSSQPISVAAFAKKVVAQCENLDYAAFASAQVIVLVTSQVPYAMDLILAELHKACIYTVPKYVAYSKSAFDSEKAYYKDHLGFKEEDGQLESSNDYSRRMDACMRLYGALVQTEIPGLQNTHGPKEGWSWLARFLNTLPANAFTATALNAFLQMAGFSLYRKYKSQFAKMLQIVLNDFVKALKGRNDQDLRPIVTEIESYIQDRSFLKVPEGLRMEGKPLLSSRMPAEPEYNNSYYQQW